MRGKMMINSNMFFETEDGREAKRRFYERASETDIRKFKLIAYYHPKWYMGCGFLDEAIRLAGYTEEEVKEIFRKHSTIECSDYNNESN